MPEKFSKDQLEAMSIIELRKLAKTAKLSNITKMHKADLVAALAPSEKQPERPRRVMAHVESLPATADLKGDKAAEAAKTEPRYSHIFRSAPPVRPAPRSSDTSSQGDEAGEPGADRSPERRPLREEMQRGRGFGQRPARAERADTRHTAPPRAERVEAQEPLPRTIPIAEVDVEAVEAQRQERPPAYQRSHDGDSRRDQRHDRQDRQGKRGGREAQSVQNDLDQAYFQQGVLDIVADSNYGFIRQRAFRLGKDDIYISMSQIKKFGLRTGDLISGYVRPPREGERFPSMVKIEAVNDRPPDENRKRVSFEELTPVYPDHRLFLESDAADPSTRLIDLFAPVGLGTRGIIVAKPKAGKTIMLKKIANSIAKNHPDVELIAVLIDERPEEVTDFERTIQGEVISSTFDEKPEHHIQVAEMVIEYAKRKVEAGRDIVILLDSLTRMARAYNLTCPPSGKTLSGGLDPNSLYKPKSFLGAARNVEGGGSLTILATALIETGSRLDDIIFEEFKGTANMELHLSRELADKRIFPAIDIMKSGTRHEELLYNADEMDVVWRLRKMVADMDEADRMNRLITKLLQTKSNVELLFQVRKATE
jgi:transcription termination factor Rho